MRRIPMHEIVFFYQRLPLYCKCFPYTSFLLQNNFVFKQIPNNYHALLKIAIITLSVSVSFRTLFFYFGRRQKCMAAAIFSKRKKSMGKQN